MNKIQVYEYSTFYKVPKIENANYSPLRKSLSTINYYTKNYDPYGYAEYKTHIKVMKVPKGILINNLKEGGIYCDIIRRDDFPVKKAKPFNMKNEPKNDIQKEVIDFTLDKFKSGESRSIISLKTGRGKTYVATNIIHNLGVRAIIMVKTLGLKKQWLESFKTHTTCNNIFTVDKGADLVALLDSQNFNPDVVICLHKSMSQFIETCGKDAFARLLMKLGIGIKVYDEFDLENASMFNMDMHSSVKYNLYLSATDFKSSSDENYVFKRIFMNVPNIGKDYEDDTKRNGIFFLYQSRPTKREYASCMQYTSSGFTFSYQKYHEYTIHKFAFEKALKNLWDKFIKIRYRKGLKTIFFIGRKTTASYFRDKISKLFDIPIEKIAILNSDTPKKDREVESEKLLIVSTSNSMGRGIDLRNLDTLVDFETRNSISSTEQVIGRVSRMGMENIGTYIQFVDESFPVVKRNFDKKNDKCYFDTLLTNIKVVDI